MPVDGLDKILANLTKKEADLRKTVFVGMKYALKETVNYGKEAYSRPATGKGFTDRTTNLRNSWNSTVLIDGINVVGYVHVGWGNDRVDEKTGKVKKNYAYYVETRWDGKYAYLYPSVNDKREYIFDTVKILVQKRFA
jgi:CobQ-like glutamine amidotransferase family enzyme